MLLLERIILGTIQEKLNPFKSLLIFMRELFGVDLKYLNEINGTQRGYFLAELASEVSADFPHQWKFSILFSKAAFFKV